MDERTVFFGDPYTGYIDYGRTLAEMIEAGKYDMLFHIEDINERNFPIKRPSAGNELVVGDGPFRRPGIQNNNIQTVVCYLNKLDSSIQQIDKGRIEHLLALGERYPNLQLEFPIIASGSIWVDERRDRYMPYLHFDGPRRLFGLLPDSPGHFRSSGGGPGGIDRSLGQIKQRQPFMLARRFLAFNS